MRSPTPDDLRALPAGTRVRDYVIHRVLGQGGFGITYLARHEGLGRLTALKECLPADLATRAAGQIVPLSESNRATFDWAIDSFLREAQTLATFRHLHIVSVFDVFRLGGTGYMATEYVEGHNLAAWAERQGNRFTPAALDAILPALLQALETLHAQGIIHRDLKPDNILVRTNGEPVLIDFGAARQAVGGRSRTLTAILTPGFAPIEQYGAEGKQGPWTDLYALAATLHLLMRGAPPPAAVEQVLRGTRHPLAGDPALRSFSPALLRALDACLALQPGDRPQSIAAFRALFAPRATPPPQASADWRDQSTRVSPPAPEPPPLPRAAPRPASPPAAPKSPPPAQSVDEHRALVEAWAPRITEKKIYLAPNIPPNLLQNALQAYATGILAREVLVLVDSTLMGNAREGAVVTRREIVVKDCSSVTVRHPADKMREIDCKGSFMPRLLWNRQTLLGLGALDSDSVKQLVALLHALANARSTASSIARPKHVGEVVQAYRTRIRNEKVHFAPDIPSHLLNNVLKRYGKGLRPEHVLLLVDNSNNNTAYDGFILTNLQIVAHDPFSRTFAMAFKDLCAIRVKRGLVPEIQNHGFTVVSLAYIDEDVVILLGEMLIELSRLP